MTISVAEDLRAHYPVKWMHKDADQRSYAPTPVSLLRCKAKGIKNIAGKRVSRQHVLVEQFARKCGKQEQRHLFAKLLEISRRRFIVGQGIDHQRIKGHCDRTGRGRQRQRPTAYQLVVRVKG